MCAPQYGPDPCEELAEAERLDDVVVCAELQADDPVDLLALGGDDDDRHVGAGAQQPADLGPVDVGEPEVEQHEIGKRGGERRSAGRDAADVEAFAPESLDEGLRDRVVVLDDQDPAYTGS